MRIFQIILLVLAGVAFIAGAIFIFFNPCIGLVLWRVGVAILLWDIMLFLLWPTSP